MSFWIVALTALAAGLIGWIGPTAIAKVPEPEPDPADDEPKPLYADIAAVPRLGAWLAAVSAALGAVAALSIAEPALLPAWVVLTGVGVWLSYVDWHTRYLPYRITAPLHLAVLALVVAASAVTGDWSLIIKGLIGNVVVFVVFLLINLIGYVVSQPFGYGDVRLSAILGLALGAVGSQATIVGLYAGFILGAVLGLVLAKLKVVNPKGFAFGPYLVLGAFVGLAGAAIF